MNANNNRNNNNVDDVVVVHKIPKLTRGGLSPLVGLSIMAGEYNRITHHELDRRFVVARLLAAVEANAKANGVAIIPPDE
jgi:hypothetical protein